MNTFRQWERERPTAAGVLSATAAGALSATAALVLSHPTDASSMSKDSRSRSAAALTVQDSRSRSAAALTVQRRQAAIETSGTYRDVGDLSRRRHAIETAALHRDVGAASGRLTGCGPDPAVL